MRNTIVRVATVAAAALALATSAKAQDHKHDRDHRDDKHHGDRDRNHDRDDDRSVVVHRANGDVVLPQRIPPGLAKKPGGLPPGQFRKRWSTNDGAGVLSDVLRRRGYFVDRVATAGQSRYVYYRAPNGHLVRAIVSPGSDRLGFANVPGSLLQEVLSRLY